MNCNCGNIIVKTDIFGRLKSLRGTLIYYSLNNRKEIDTDNLEDNKYINECCFVNIVNSLYTLKDIKWINNHKSCLLYTSPSPRDGLLSRMPSSA